VRRILVLVRIPFLLLSITSVAQNTISTIAGGGSPLNGTNPLNAVLGYPTGVVKDGAGNVYVSAKDLKYVFNINFANNITVLAGTGYSGFTGIGGPATQAVLSNPSGLALDGTGSNLFITDFSQVFELNLASGILTNFAGTANANPMGGFGGDGGPATLALMTMPQGVAVFGGIVYIADTGNNRIRAVSGGIITTFAGTGATCPNPTGTPACGDGSPATQATLNGPRGVAVDNSGNVYVADNNDNRVRQISIKTGVITTFAGDGTLCQTTGCGDGGLATAAQVSGPTAMFIDAADDVYIADKDDSLIRFVNSKTQVISTVAGGGNGGDGGPATLASLANPSGVFLDTGGNLLIAEQGNNRVRIVNTNGIINTLAGGGSGGDGGPALGAAFANTHDIVVDDLNNQFIVDRSMNRIREVASGTQLISTVVGSNTGVQGSTGDGGPATSATLDFPEGLAMDALGNIFISDEANNSIRTVQGGIFNLYAGGNGGCSPSIGAVRLLQAQLAAQPPVPAAAKRLGQSGQKHDAGMSLP